MYTLTLISTLNTFSSPVRTDLDNVPQPNSFLSNRLSSPVLVLPVPVHLLPLSLSLSLSLSAEWLAEMDVMRQVHAGREMEAVPWRSAAVNKVKNNQVMVDCSSRGPTAATGTAAMQQYITFTLEMTFFIYMHLQSTLVSCGTVQLTLFFCLFAFMPVLI